MLYGESAPRENEGDNLAALKRYGYTRRYDGALARFDGERLIYTGTEIKPGAAGGGSFGMMAFSRTFFILRVCIDIVLSLYSTPRKARPRVKPLDGAAPSR